MSDPQRIKVVVTGGRSYEDRKTAYNVLSTLGLADKDEYRMPTEIEIAHGGARGADTIADDWAVVHWVPVTVFEAEWDRYGKKAGALRNTKMLKEYEPDLVVAFPGGKGTAHCCWQARSMGIPVLEIPRDYDHEREKERILRAREEALNVRHRALG